jgi:signal transduction histidine kinase
VKFINTQTFDFNTKAILVVVMGYLLLNVYKFVMQVQPDIAIAAEQHVALAQTNIKYLLVTGDEINPSVMEQYDITGLYILNKEWFVINKWLAPDAQYELDHEMFLACKAQGIDSCIIKKNDGLVIKGFSQNDVIVIFKIMTDKITQSKINVFYYNIIIEAFIILVLLCIILTIRQRKQALIKRDFSVLSDAPDVAKIELVSQNKSQFEKIRHRILTNIKEGDALLQQHDHDYEMSIKMVENELKQKRREKTSLQNIMASSAHEMRNSTHGMNAKIEHLIDTYPELTYELESIKCISEGMDMHLGNLLNFNALVETHSYSKERVNIHKEIERIMLIARMKLRSEYIDLLVYCTESVPEYIETFQTPLISIIENLTFNALKYTVDGSVIVKIDYLESNSRIGKLNITVKDTGVGIPQDKLHNIFLRYKQNNEYSENNGGVGLGLYMVKEFCEFLGSSPDIYSKVGVGTTVNVKVNVTESGKAMIKHQGKALVFTKSKDIYDCIESRLFFLGYQCVWDKNHIEDDAYDLALNDINSVQEDLLNTHTLTFKCQYSHDSKIVSLCDENWRWANMLHQTRHGLPYQSVEKAATIVNDDIIHVIKTSLHVLKNLAEANALDHETLYANIERLESSTESLFKHHVRQVDLAKIFDNEIKLFTHTVPSLKVESGIGYDFPHSIELDSVKYQSALQCVLQILQHSLRQGQVTFLLSWGMDTHTLKLNVEAKACSFAHDNYQVDHWMHDDGAITDIEIQQAVIRLKEQVNALTGDFSIAMPSDDALVIELTIQVSKFDIVLPQTSPAVMCVVGGGGAYKNHLINRMNYLHINTLEWFESAEALLASDVFSCVDAIWYLEEDENELALLNTADKLCIHYRQNEYKQMYISDMIALLDRLHTPPVHSDLKVMMIDDQQDNLNVFRTMMKHTDAQVYCVLSAEEALQQDLDSFDIVFTDVNLDGMQGTTFARVVREELKLTMTIVLCSASGADWHRETSDLADIKMIAKPFNKDALMALVS